MEKMKRQITDWEKIFITCISNKGFASRIQKLLQFSKEKINSSKEKKKDKTDNLQKIYMNSQ